MIISKRYKEYQIGEQIKEDSKSYKVMGIDKLVNATGGTDYIVEESLGSRIKNKLFGR